MKSNLSRYINFIKLISILFCCINSTHAGRRKSTPTKSLSPIKPTSFSEFGTVIIRKTYKPDTLESCDLIKEIIKPSNKTSLFAIIGSELMHIMTNKHTNKHGIFYACPYCEQKKTNKSCIAKHIKNKHGKKQIFHQNYCNYENCNYHTQKLYDYITPLKEIAKHTQLKHNLSLKFDPNNCKSCQNFINRRRTKKKRPRL